MPDDNERYYASIHGADPDETHESTGATLAEDERAVAEVAEILNDLIVTHDMWIDDEGNDLDYLPEREARIANFINEASAHLAPLLAAARAAGVAQERERIVARLRRLSDEASVRELADHNAYARRCAYDRAARIAGEAEGAKQK